MGKNFWSDSWIETSWSQQKRVRSITKISEMRTIYVLIDIVMLHDTKDVKVVLCLSSSFLHIQALAVWLREKILSRSTVTSNWDICLLDLGLFVYFSRVHFCCSWILFVYVITNCRNIRECFFKKTFMVWFYLIPDICKNKTVAVLLSLQFCVTERCGF